jgi:hypothetical protein
MQQVPADISVTLERRLDRAQVPADQRPDYHKWVRFYLDFCSKYGHSPALPTSLSPFLTKLAAKNQSVGQRNQAAAAVRLLIQAGLEPDPTPAPRPATPAGRPPATLGQTLRKGSAVDRSSSWSPGRPGVAALTCARIEWCRTAPAPSQVPIRIRAVRRIVDKDVLTPLGPIHGALNGPGYPTRGLRGMARGGVPAALDSIQPDGSNRRT